MTRAERAVLATSQARDLCLSLRRAFVGRCADVDRLGLAEGARFAEGHETHLELRHALEANSASIHAAARDVSESAGRNGTDDDQVANSGTQRVLRGSCETGT